MRYDFITDEILQNYKFFEIQFDGEQHACVHGDKSLYIPPLGTEFYKQIGNKDDLHVTKPTPAIDISSFGDQITLIFKYKLTDYGSIRDVCLGSFFGYYPNLRNTNATYANEYTIWFSGCILALSKGIENKGYTNYELAFEIKPRQFKTWLNGKLMSRFEWETLKVFDPHISFGGSTKFYLNDVFCINKSEFLPDNYSVNWREPWYETIYKPIYTHHNETFYSK